LLEMACSGIFCDHDGKQVCSSGQTGSGRLTSKCR
jgi:hypothetical protein